MSAFAGWNRRASRKSISLPCKAATCQAIRPKIWRFAQAERRKRWRPPCSASFARIDPIHGLLSFAVSQRSREIGVRVALGATPFDILSMVLRQAAFVAVAGVLPGAIQAYQAGQAMQALLAGVKPNDPATFLAAAALCLAMTLFGSLLPAWRAVRVDPISALRAELRYCAYGRHESRLGRHRK